MGRSAEQVASSAQVAWIELPRQLDVSDVEAAVTAVVERHQALRTRFRWVDGSWRVAGAAESGPVRPARVSIDGLSAEEAEQLGRRESAALRQSFDLEFGELIACSVIEQEHRPRWLLMAIHDLAVDHTSWQVLLAELDRAFAQRAVGQGIDLGPVDDSFEQWWRSRDEPAAAVETTGNQDAWTSPGTIDIELGEDESHWLLGRTQASQPSTRAVLLQALAEAYARWCGRREFQVDLAVDGRELCPHLDLSRAVGRFTESRTVRVPADATETTDAVHRLDARLAEAIEASSEAGSKPGGQSLVGFDDLALAGSTSEPARARLAKPIEVDPRSFGPPGLSPVQLGVRVVVLDGRIRLRLRYPDSRHQQAVALAAHLPHAVRMLCRIVAGDVMPWTSADFPLARLDRRELEAALAGRVSVEDLYPLSPLQKGMFFHNLNDPSMYWSQVYLDIKGNFELPALEEAWRRVVRRTPVLRTSVVWKGLEEPHQLVHADVDLPIRHETWSARPPEEKHRLFDQLCRSERASVPPLSAAPLLRIALVDLGDQNVRVVVTCHHMLIDRWSSTGLFTEVLDEARAIATGAEPAVRPRRPFRDFIAWLAEQDYGEAEHYWTSLLADFHQPTPLPGMREGSADAGKSGNTAWHEVRLESSKSRALTDWARRNGLTLSTVLQGAWALILHRYSGESQVVFGSTSSGRPADLPGAEGIIGMFINTLPVYTRIDRTQPIIQWLHELQDRQAESRQYEYSALFDIQRWSGLGGGTPLFSSHVVLENEPNAGPRGDATSRPYDFMTYSTGGHDNSLLAVTMEPGPPSIIYLHYDPAAIDADTATDLATGLEELLVSFARQPGLRVGDYSVLSKQHRDRVLVQWNDTSRRTRDDIGTVPDLVAAHASRDPGAIALEVAGQRLSYRDLIRRVDSMAAILRKHGLGPDVLGGVCLPRSIDLVVAILGVLRAGGAYVPLDPAYPSERLDHLVRDSDPRIVLTHRALTGRLPAFRGEPLLLDEIDADAGGSAPAAGPVAVSNLNLAYVIYTSGSTGRPKGSMVTHQGLRNVVAAEHELLGIGPGDRVLQSLSPSFDVSVLEITMALCAGATLCLAPPEGLAGKALADFLREHDVTVACIPPAVLAMTEPYEIPSLRLVLTGGEQCTEEVADRWSEKVAFLNLYGATEATIWSTTATHVPGTGRPAIGRPLRNTRTYVVDEDLAVSPIGVAGELMLAGDGLQRGYLNRPALTAERMVPDPFGPPGSRLYRTGDRVRYRASGELEYIGRSDDQVKLRGNRIEPAEIEAQLEAHETVREAVVLAVADHLVAYVRMDPGGTVDGLRAHLADRLPEWMIPARITQIESWPLAPTGKVDRQALAERARTIDERPAPAAEAAPAETMTELELLDIWERVLGTRPPGVDAGFYELGGHSLLAVRVTDEVKRFFGVDLSLMELFREPTIRRMAEVLSQDPASLHRQPLVPIQSGSGTPLIGIHPGNGSVRCYRRLAQCLDPDEPVYGIQDTWAGEPSSPYATVEEIAAAYVGELARIENAAPYRLIGYSFGGWIAFEMARQLRSSGGEIELLALVDTPAPGALPAVDETDVAALLEVFVHDMLHGSERIRGMDVRHYLTGDGGLDPIGRFVSLVWPEPSEQPAGRAWIEQAVRQLAREVRLCQQYIPDRAYPGDVLLFRASERPTGGIGFDADLAADPTLGWDRVCRSVEVRWLPGHHDALMTSPALDLIAGRVGRSLTSEVGETDVAG